MESVELTSEDPQIVVYKVNPKAVWSDGDPDRLRRLLPAWISSNGVLAR